MFSYNTNKRNYRFQRPLLLHNNLRMIVRLEFICPAFNYSKIQLLCSLDISNSPHKTISAQN